MGTGRAHEQLSFELGPPLNQLPKQEPLRVLRPKRLALRAASRRGVVLGRGDLAVVDRLVLHVFERHRDAEAAERERATGAGGAAADGGGRAARGQVGAESVGHSLALCSDGGASSSAPTQNQTLSLPGSAAALSLLQGRSNETCLGRIERSGVGRLWVGEPGRTRKPLKHPMQRLGAL